MSFVDDHSGVIKIYLLKRKSNAIIELQSRFLTNTAPFGPTSSKVGQCCSFLPESFVEYAFKTR